MGKNSFGKVGKKVCPVGCLSLVLYFNVLQSPKVAIEKFVLKIHYEKWVGLFLLDDLLSLFAEDILIVPLYDGLPLGIQMA